MKRLLLIGAGLAFLFAFHRARRNVEVSPPNVRERALPTAAATVTASAPPRPTTRSRGLPLLAGVWVFIAGVFVGGTVIPHVNDRPSFTSPPPTYAPCISQARYAHPIQDNQYQELVNALYTCGIYKEAR